MIVTCKKDGLRRVNALICVYSCDVKTKICCKTYEEIYDALKAMLIEKKYIDKYGPPGFVEPKSRQVKKTRKKKEDKPKVIKADKSHTDEVEVKPKRKRRTKAEMAEARKYGKP